MDKKEIYEHLAKIYLDASTSKRKKKTKKYPQIPKTVFIIILSILIPLNALFFYRYIRQKTLKTEVALLLQNEPVKINFHFNPVKKETFSINLNQLDLSRYKVLAFTLKKTDFKDQINMRIEFVNSFEEKSEVYLKGISTQWEDKKINLAEFRKISDWSNMTGLSFTIEEWNAKEKKDVVYIDNIKLLR